MHAQQRRLPWQDGCKEFAPSLICHCNDICVDFWPTFEYICADSRAAASHGQSYMRPPKIAVRLSVATVRKVPQLDSTETIRLRKGRFSGRGSRVKNVSERGQDNQCFDGCLVRPGSPKGAPSNYRVRSSSNVVDDLPVPQDLRSRAQKHSETMEAGEHRSEPLMTAKSRRRCSVSSSPAESWHRGNVESVILTAILSHIAMQFLKSRLVRRLHKPIWVVAKDSRSQ